MIEKIDRKTDVPTLQSIQKLISSSKPNILYGAGWYADFILDKLTSRGVTIEDVCVDDKYFSYQILKGIQVIPISEVCKKYDSYNIIIAHVKIREAIQILSGIIPKEDIYYFDTAAFNDFYSDNFLHENKTNIEKAYYILEDHLSKEIFTGFINCRMNKNIDYILHLPTLNNWYFDSEVFDFSDNEVLLDIGAYDGDSIKVFVDKFGDKYNKIIAMEPDCFNYKKLVTNIAKRRIKRCDTLNIGAWNKIDKLSFNMDSGSLSGITDKKSEKNEVFVDTVDNLFSNQKITFIKMDIEGAELAALKGAVKVITANKPKLAICVYHKPQDIYEIPLFIKSIVPDYKFYLRRQFEISMETILFCHT